LHDKKHEPTEEFYLDLSDPSGCQLQPGSATIVVIDAEHRGTLSFAEPQLHVPESTEKHDISIEVKRTGGANGDVKCNYRTEQDTAVPDHDYMHVQGVLEFKDKQVSATIKVEILPKGRYESTEHFRVILDQPQNGVQFDPLTDGGQDKQICTVFIDADPTTTAHMDSVMRHFQVNWDVLTVGHTKYKDQFIEAWYVNGSKEEAAVSKWRDCVLHVICMPWKLMFACVPPTDFAGGWVCFFSALAMIGIVTAVIGDLAALLGCSLGISDSATAITIVALGTSLPDTFASKTAAVQDPTADASIGNVTGSNSVNVFLGLGLPWFMGAIYWTVVGAKEGDAWYAKMAEEKWPSSIKANHPNGAFVVVAGNLGMSVGVFCVCAILCLGTLVLRRKHLGGELGGDKKWAYATAVFFTFLWLVYISASIGYELSQE
jgi:solute carrier family 8 (sodium/calcium exchanger)